MRPICVFGLWHLGCVTATCLADAGFKVRALDLNQATVRGLRDGRVPIKEPGLDELLQKGVCRGNLSFTSNAAEALVDAAVLWVTFDTPVDESDRADPDWVRAQLETIRHAIQPSTLILVSSQVPVGFAADLERTWSVQDPSLTFANSPENLRLGQALSVFRSPERVIVGLGANASRNTIVELFAPFTSTIEWMSLESAEMTKHALNSFLAVSVAYANELARICERVGADARQVERGLRSDQRVGARAYVTPGAAFAGGTLARDIAFLIQLASTHDLEAPLFEGARLSNELQLSWTRDHISNLLAGIEQPTVALLGLTYKPETSTLRRSSSVELGAWLTERGVAVRAYDPAVTTQQPELGRIEVAESLSRAIADSDLAVLATPWSEFRHLTADQLVAHMSKPRIVDPASYLAHLADDDRITYVGVGRPDPTWSAQR